MNQRAATTPRALRAFTLGLAVVIAGGLTGACSSTGSPPPLAALPGSGFPAEDTPLNEDPAAELDTLINAEIARLDREPTRPSPLTELLDLGAGLDLPQEEVPAEVVNEEPEDPDAWQFTVAPKPWVPWVNCKIGTQESSVAFNWSLTKTLDVVLDNFSYLFELALEARKGRFFFRIEGVAVQLENEEDHLDWEYTQLTALTVVGYRIFEDEIGKGGAMPRLSIDALAGARWWYLDMELDPKGPILPNVEKDKFWVDPVVGGVITLQLSDDWRITTYGTLGGFGVGSDFAWTLASFVGWSTSDWFELQAGWLYIGTNYDDDEFLANIRYHGPFLVAAFKF